MKVKDIYLKTMKFSLIKLGLGAAVTAASIILLLLSVAIGSACDSSVVWAIMLFVWVMGSAVLYRIMMNYAGYMIKAAHVAVIAESVTTGQIPDNMIEYGKNKVQQRFVEANAYLVLDKLVSGAVKQLQKAVGAVGNALDFVPGMGSITSIAQSFVGISLGYVDECCLGYSFIQNNKSAFEAGSDGVVVYFQNAKHLLKNAAVATLIVLVATFAVWFAPFILLALLFSALHWNVLIAFAIAIIIAICLKVAFVDSYMLIKMMYSYMEVAPQTVISFDLYEKLCGLSRSFRKLFDKARENIGTPNYGTPNYANQNYVQNANYNG